jgi:hypothetical protein
MNPSHCSGLQRRTRGWLIVFLLSRRIRSSTLKQAVFAQEMVCLQRYVSASHVNLLRPAAPHQKAWHRLAAEGNFGK